MLVVAEKELHNEDNYIKLYRAQGSTSVAFAVLHLKDSLQSYDKEVKERDKPQKGAV